ncbi:MAG: AI-2E family transporter, partial [Candidatus Hydrogenedentales bacterium]
MTETTKALDDAAERISRYLLMQLAVNGSYGLTWAIGLYLIGVDYALLWGFLATVLRYVPYVGAPIAALFPICLSLAQFPGWWQPLAVIALVLVLDLIS